MVQGRNTSLPPTRIPGDRGTLREVAGRRALPRDVGEQVRFLQMAVPPVVPVGQGREEDRGDRPLPGVPRQVPEPRIPVAQRQDPPRPRARLLGRVRQEVLPLRGHQVRGQALQVQGPRRAQEDVPEPRAGLATAHRPDAMRGKRHDGLLGRREVLGAHPVHGPLERRDRRLRPVFEKGRPVDLFPGAGHLPGTEEKVPRTENDIPLRSRLGVLLEGIQRNASPT